MKLFYYQLKNILKTKETVWWTAAFPLVLGTLFYLTFGTAKVDDQFSKIPVGVVWNQEDAYFASVLDEVEGDLFETTDYEEEDAKKALQKEKIDAYIVVGDSITMKTMKSSIQASIVEVFLNEYLSYKSAIETIAKEHPEKLAELVGQISDDSKGSITVKDDSVDMDDYNPYITFFYALVAMTCLFGGFLSQGSISELQADQSALGARKNIAPISKMKLLVVDVLTTWLVSFTEIMIALFYLVGILKLNFGADLKYMIILALAGSYFGNSLGIFTTIFVKGDFGKKNAVLLTISLVFSFFGGLMFANMIDIVEHHIPVLNRINPAALMVHAFQSLQIYGDTKIFYRNLLLLMIFAIVMNIASVCILRRKRYANI